MIKGKKKIETRRKGWLLFFYSVPSKPVSNRMKIWRKLAKVGAVQLKGAVYILPQDEEHYEFVQWLVSEVTSIGGDAAFARIEGIESMEDREIIELFTNRKMEDYRSITRALEDLETRMSSVTKGSRTQSIKVLSERLRKLSKAFEEIKKTDFFGTSEGISIGLRIKDLKTALPGVAGPPSEKTPDIPRKRTEDYQGRVWVSRKRPFIDRMASAWLIRKFIDKEPSFLFVEEKDPSATGKDHVAFDMSGGEFTHVGELCTFEVLARSFGIKEKAVKKISEIVHELDIKDDKYKTAEAGGLEEILSGIRKSEKDDNIILEKGISVFEMLYASKAR